MALSSRISTAIDYGSLPQLLTDMQVAALIGVSVSTLRKARMGEARNGKLYPPFVKLGRSVRYRLNDVVVWINGLQSKKVL
jgi:predicted DNA-binding transcriptional regulator AlpA